MKRNVRLPIACALVLAAAPLAATAQTTFFSDDFAYGSTLNSASPADPTPTNTAYQIVSSKSWTPAPALTANDLKFGIAPTTSGSYEIQALFATNAVALTQIGDYVKLTVVFTNTSGVLLAVGQLGVGLYNSGQVKPLAGGMNGTATTSTSGVTGGAQNWLGYVAQVNFNGANSRIMTRPAQSITTGNNQDLVTSGSGSSSYTGQTTVGSTYASTVALTAGAVYTEVLTITLNDVSSLAITNTLYAGANTSGTVLTNFGGVATNTTYLAGGFDALAFGYRAGANTYANTIDVSSIAVSGSVTVISGPPTITSEPEAAAVVNGGSCAFNVAAQGFTMSYRWHRDGTNLVNGGNISGATSPRLVISPAGPADELSGASGYYVTVTGAGNFSTNSFTNSLTLVATTNLTWSSGSSAWDVNVTPSWQDDLGNPGLYFTYGDPVTFDDIGGGGAINLTGPYLSAESVTVNNSIFYTFQGTGSFAGPGRLIYVGSAQLTVNNPNTFSGGTLISNATANLRLQNLNGLGSGPITLAAGQLEILTGSSSTTGVASDFIVADDFTLLMDPVNTSFGLVMFGNLSGTASKTLTINHPNGGTNNTRIRLTNTNIVYDANLVLNDSTLQWSPSPGSGSQTYNGVISGAGSLLQKSSTTYLNGSNTYSGGTFPAAGAIGLGLDSDDPVTSGPIGTGPLLLQNDSTTTLAGSGSLFASGGPRTLANPIQYPSGSNNLTLILGGTNSLTLSGAFPLNGNDGGGAGTNRTIQADNTALSTISGVISDGGLGVGLIKSGTNTLVLSNTETYTGPTTVSAGTLQVNGALAAASTVTVSSNATLAGTGTIGGSVAVNLGGAIAPGASIGTLNIGGNLNLTGNLKIEVNKSLSPAQSNDVVSVSGGLTNLGVGRVLVTNLGPALALGDRFVLFNGALTNGGALSVSGAGVYWSNNLALDGSISVAPPTPPTIVTQPASRAVAPGASVSLAVAGSTVTGVTNYQWQMNSNTITASNVSGTNTSTLTITNFQAPNAGYYRVMVGDGIGSTTSDNASITLAVSPAIGVQAVSATTMTVQVPTEVGPTYLVQTNGNLATANWQTAATITGDGTVKPFVTGTTSSPQLFIRIKLQ